MRPVVVCLLGVVGPVAIAVVSPASAESLKSVVRTLNAIVNPEDAWRLEDQARHLIDPAKRVIGATTARGSSSSAVSAAKQCRPMVIGTDIRHQ